MSTPPVRLDDYETLARDRLAPSAYDYYAGGAGDEWTVAENRRAFDRRVLWPRVLVNVAAIDTSTAVLGVRLALPVLLAPTAFHRLAHPEGELAAARAAAAAGTVMIASTLSTATLEEIRAASAGPMWFQLYVYRDREITKDLVQRATAAGYGALVLTVDSPVLGRRDRDRRNGFTLPADLAIRNLEHRWEHDFAAYIRDQFDPSLDWDAVAWLKSFTPLPLVLKGILTPEDARLGVTAGAAAIVVSNHGGRQLDGVPASLDALPAVAAAVGGDVAVLMDGGVRRGTDVLKALALGARAVLIGRPYLWALAVAGEAGVCRVLDLLREELETAMALSGRPTIASIDGSLLGAPGAER